MAKQHGKTTSHLQKLNDLKGVGRSVVHFFQPKVGDGSNKSGLENKAMAAELRWVLHTVETSKSFNSEDNVASLFAVMFGDS